MIRSPFKFLDSYQETDKNLFFGREDEVKNLYDAINATKLLMVYGASGTGKTSIIECGLRNQFSPLDWEAVGIRRNQHIYASFFEQVNLRLSEKKKIAVAPNEKGLVLPASDMSMAGAVKILYQAKFKPIYLLFDQFEELLILGEEAEKQQFFAELQSLLETKIPCRILLILREEFIGHLSEYEKNVPALFRHRFRVEKMNKGKVETVIRKTLAAASDFQPPFEVENAELLTKAMLQNLPDDQREIELAHLQVYLDKLWKRDYEQAQATQRPVKLRADLISANDKLATILTEFLKEQFDLLTGTDKRLLPLEVLATMITQEGTKLQRTFEEIMPILQENGISFQAQEIKAIISHFSQYLILRPLKSGDITRYELSHDLLARIVQENRTQEMQLREKAADIYAVYQERKGYFSQEDLDYLRPYQQYKAYPKDLQELITKSEEYIRKEQAEELEKARQIAEKEKQLRENAEQAKQTAKIRSRIAIFVAVIAFLALGGAVWQYQDALAQKAIANQERDKSDSLRVRSDSMYKEIQIKTGMIVEEKKNVDKALLETEAQKNLANQKTEEAIKSFTEKEEAQKSEKEETRKKNEALYKATISAGNTYLAQKKYNEAIVEFKKAIPFSSNPVEALNLKEQAENERNQYSQYTEYIHQAEAISPNKIEEYELVYDKFNKALSTGYNDDGKAKEKVSSIGDILVNLYLKKAKPFYEAGVKIGYDNALPFYQKALKIHPNDKTIAAKIQECQSQLK